jgi:TonB family protein
LWTPKVSRGNIRIARSVGLGLDQKAIDAVRRWRFEPAMKGGRPVAVQVSVEVSFRLY